jgi:hypothetical protein
LIQFVFPKTEARMLREAIELLGLAEEAVDEVLGLAERL